MCPPPLPFSPSPLTCAAVDKGSLSSVRLSLRSPDDCEFKIWQKIRGVFDEWKVLSAPAENLYQHKEETEECLVFYAGEKLYAVHLWNIFYNYIQLNAVMLIIISFLLTSFD